ncbi:MAG: helix-turn-helix transcriptional regulator [Tannerellaceae bacterium]|jgi:transcriptional regulator with XRE-family HTH domain|nr:helix-turn-helix transcriptional regulator [Tannerellaceae bacterium]
MKDRILQIMHREGLTPAKFAEVIEVQRSTISHIAKARNEPSLDVIKKILEKYPYVDRDWLLFGTGSMVRSKTASKTIQPDLFADNIPINTPPQTPIIPPRKTTPPENRREIEVEKPQKNNRPLVQEPVVIKKVESRNVSKIMIFYSDNTYETFIPEKIKKD